MIDRKNIEQLDWILLVDVILLAFLGILTIHSVTYNDPGTPDYLKQIGWTSLGILILIGTVIWDYKYLLKLSLLYYTISIGLLIYLLSTQTILGVRRWIDIFGLIRVQPSEIAKVTLILILANVFSKIRCRRISHLIIPVILTGIPFVLIVIQPDLGTALILAPLFVIMIFISGFSIKKMMIFAAVIALAAAIIGPYTLKPYQLKRIISFVNPEEDPLGSGYHLIQSKIAIGSGGLKGKGFKSGSQSHLDFLPVQDTDFIFSVWCEEHGFIGAVILLGLFVVMLFRTTRIARQTHEKAGAYLCIGFAVMLFCQILINTGMVMGLMPITGLPLPFLSYGGSACLINFFCIGLILNVGMRKYPKYQQ